MQKSLLFVHYHCSRWTSNPKPFDEKIDDVIQDYKEKKESNVQESEEKKVEK